MIRLANLLMLLALAALTGCMQAPPVRDDPAYAPVLPRTPLPQELNNGAIYQPGFEMSLYNDRKAHRVGDIITITLSESTAAQKKAENEIDKDSSTTIANPTILGNAVGFKGLDLGVSMSGQRALKAAPMPIRAIACLAPSRSPWPRCCPTAFWRFAARSGSPSTRVTS